MKQIRSEELARRRAAALSPSVAGLIQTYEGLSFDLDRGRLDCDGYTILRLDAYPGVEPATNLPSIAHGDFVYYLIPDNANLPGYFGRGASYLTDAAVLSVGVARIGPADWPNDAEIIRSLDSYVMAGLEIKRFQSARQLLERERNSDDLYASKASIAEVTPMLVGNFMRERGVSVFYGAWDEFKTTVVLDIAAHAAMGVDWQGRKVKPRPVIWYALEGADEIPVRLRALESRLKAQSPAWGDDGAPISCRDRIPDDPIEWRREICSVYERWFAVYSARVDRSEIAKCWGEVEDGFGPIVVIDTLSIALGGEDEKGPRAAGFINECLDLLKRRDDLSDDESGLDLRNPAASHVIVIHHQTKTGVEFAGHRAIAANTQGLYRVHRFGKMTDSERPYAGQITPYRVKGIQRPKPIRFEVEVVDKVDGTSQTAAILRSKSASIPGDLAPIVDVLREHPNRHELSPAELKELIDPIAAADGREGAALRKARQRIRDSLKAGILEPIEDDAGKLIHYIFHDPS